MRPFEPLFSNPHLSTLAGNFWKRSIDEERFPTQSLRIPTEPGTRILVHLNKPSGDVRGAAVLQHGLEGSSSSGYMISLAQALCEAGFASYRVNMRGCGGSEGLTNTLYHSGLTADLRILLQSLRDEHPGPLVLVGFSLGANASLKLAGELGEEARSIMDGVVAVSTPIDLAECVKRIDTRENWIYQQRFVLSLCRRYKRRHLAQPERFPLDGLGQVRTIFNFDDRFTAPHFGFGNAPNYYATQSSLRFVESVRIPALMIQAEDDPMIPFSLFQDERIRQNPFIELRSVPHGGHLGFIALRRPRFWLDGEIVDWIGVIAEQSGGGCRLG